MMLELQPMRAEHPEADLVVLAAEAVQDLLAVAVPPQEPVLAQPPQDLQPVLPVDDHPQGGPMLVADNSLVADVPKEHLGVDADVD